VITEQKSVGQFVNRSIRNQDLVQIWTRFHLDSLH
jgi:hypothetical protein